MTGEEPLASQNPDPSEEPANSAVPAAGSDEPITGVYRQAPRYGRFALTGLLVAAVVAFILALTTRGWSGLSVSNTFWILLIALGTTGLLAGAAIAYWLDRRSLRTQADTWKRAQP